MSIRLSQSQRGLHLAQVHKSAEGQASKTSVYKKLDRAANVPSIYSDDIRKQRNISAVHVALDRVRRLGERVRENKNVAPRDNRLMMEEFEYLREQVVRIFNRNADVLTFKGDQGQFSLVDQTSHMAGIVDSVFKGDIIPTAKITKTGDLGELETTPHIVEFSGTYRFGRSQVYIPKSSSEILTDEHGETRVFDQEQSEKQWVESAISKVRDEILIRGKTAISTQLNGALLSNAKLLFS